MYLILQQKIKSTEIYDDDVYWNIYEEVQPMSAIYCDMNKKIRCSDRFTVKREEYLETHVMKQEY